MLLEVNKSMKNIVIKRIMKYIENNGQYSKNMLVEIEYGLTGIYLTISKIIIISILAIGIGIIKEMFLFMLFFNIIRSTAFGLHATKSWICLLSSIIIFIGIPFICKILFLNNIAKIGLGISSIFLIYKNAPADTKKRPIVNKQRRKYLKIISTCISFLFVVLSILIKDNFLSNCLIFAIILENILISPLTYKVFNLPYNNYIDFLKSHPDFKQ